MSKSLCNLLLTILLLVFFGCTKQGKEGKKSLIDLITEAPGQNCKTGGYKIVSGIDINENNVLDAAEIQSTKYICNGINGNNSIASLVAEPAGPNCVTGGYKLNTGIDLNNDNVLDANEVLNSNYICNGLTGSNSLASMVTELSGPNCANGGYKVMTGVDANKNGILENTEVQNTNTICNGNNGLNYLISIKAEPAGVNCTFGGYSFNTDIDVNKNGLLDNSEITSSVYMCNNSSVNELRIPLDFSANTTSAAGVTGLALANFNKANYPGLDVIVLSARVYSVSIQSNAIVELVNLTDNVVVGGTLSSNSPFEQSTIQSSASIYDALPNKPINIGLKLRAEKEGSFAAVYSTSYLILTPKK